MNALVILAYDHEAKTYHIAPGLALWALAGHSHTGVVFCLGGH